MPLKSVLRFAHEAATSRRRVFVLARFLLVGATFAIAYSVLSSVFALVVGLRPAFASGFAHALCIPSAYLAQRSIAFRASPPHRVAFPRYVALQAPLLMLGAALSWLTIDILNAPEFFGFVAVSVIVAGASFVAQRFWTVAETDREG